MIRVKYRGELGNNMFQYAFARIVAERTGMALLCDPPHKAFYNAVSLPGIKADGCAILNESNMEDVYVNRRVSGYQTWGFFQQARYYAPYRKEIKEWFKTSGEYVSETGFNDVVIHIRRGDFAESNSIICLEEYYGELLRAKNYTQVYIIGRGIDDCTRTVFSQFNPIYIGGDELHDMGYLIGARNIIMSNSSFAWWGAFLSSADVIYYPKTVDGYFSENTHQNLLMYDHNYKVINGVKTGQ